MEAKEQKELEDIIQTFNSQTAKLLKIVDYIVPDHPDIEWLKRISKIVRYESPSLLIEKSLENIWDNKEHIISRNIKFFNTCSYDTFIEQDNHGEWLDEMVKIFRAEYFNLKQKEIDIVWKCMDTMLECVIKYRLLKESHA